MMVMMIIIIIKLKAYVCNDFNILETCPVRLTPYSVALCLQKSFLRCRAWWHQSLSRTAFLFSSRAALFFLSTLSLFCVAPHVSKTLAALIRGGRGLVCVSDFPARSCSAELDARAGPLCGGACFNVPFDTRKTERVLGPSDLFFFFNLKILKVVQPARHLRAPDGRRAGVEVWYLRLKPKRVSVAAWVWKRRGQRSVLLWIWILAWICKSVRFFSYWGHISIRAGFVEEQRDHQQEPWSHACKEMFHSVFYNDLGCDAQKFVAVALCASKPCLASV